MGVESALLAHLHDDEVFSYQSPSAPCPSLLKVPSGSEEGAVAKSLPQDYQVSPGVTQKIDFILASECIALHSAAVQGFPSGPAVKNLPAMQETQETWIRSPGWEDPLEEEMATHSSILA